MQTVTHFGTLAFRKRRQLRILRAQELAFADSYTFFVGGGDPDHGLWLAAQHKCSKRLFLGGVYVTNPVVATFLGPKVTAEAPKCVTVDNSSLRLAFGPCRNASSGSSSRQLRVSHLMP